MVPLGEIYLTDNKSFLFEILIAVVVKSSISLDVTPCIPLTDNQSFGKTCTSSGSKDKPRRNQRETNQNLLATCFHSTIFLGLFFDPEDGGGIFL
jgi:hypothetical protein